MEREEYLAAAVRTGALLRRTVDLEPDEHETRRLWLRPTVVAELSEKRIGNDQLARVHAALRRFMIGGLFNVVSRDCAAAGLGNLADIRELKTKSPPFIEMRFKPPKHHLRIFGRFICYDGLVLTSIAMKSADEEGKKKLSVSDELKRCEQFFFGQGLDPAWCPATIEQSISNAKII